MTDHKKELKVSEHILKSWQEMADILAQLLGVPAALIMRLNDPYIEVLVASDNADNPYHPGNREKVWDSGLYCETVIKKRDRLLVPDALADANWQNNPDVKLNMIAYLGFPLMLPDGSPFGTICVLDRERNEHSTLIERLIQQFRDIIEAHLEILFMNQQLGEDNKRLTDYLQELQALRGMVPICAHCKSIRDQEGKWHSIDHYLIRHPQAKFSHGICPSCMKKFYPDYSAEDD